MTTPLLTTKLYIPPVRPNVMPRPRLVERLNAGPRSGRKLTLISSRAGFGKTTLVSEWIHRSTGDVTSPVPAPLRVALLSLDEGDNVLGRFLAYLIAALQTVGSNIEQGLLAALQSAQPPPSEAILTSLVNEIAAIPKGLDPSTSGQQTLEYLEPAKLFSVPLDNERRWYRYHHLFAELLRQRLERSLPPQRGDARKAGGSSRVAHPCQQMVRRAWPGA